MQRARCGNPDLGTVNSITRPVNVDQPESLSQNLGRSAKGKGPEKYVTQSNSWPKKSLKWFIEQYPQTQQLLKDKAQINRIFEKAFDDWEKYSGLTFEMTADKKAADLKIKFNSKDHGDGYPFDGQGATLAHAFYPLAGDIHFDDDERFTDSYKNENEQYTLRLVAAHEIGHALGLAHSYEEDSLMFPVYQQFKPDYNISADDQAGIQALYGKPEDKSKVEPTKTSTSSPTQVDVSTGTLPLNNWCSVEFDTGCEGPDGELYLFKEDQVWRYRAKTKLSWDPEPTLISERFPSLTDATITACVKSTTGYVHLFRNYRMWKLRTHWSGDGPDILNGKNYPQNPRAALRHQNAIYLLRDHLLYRLNEFDHDKELEITTIDAILKPSPTERIRAGFTYDKRHYIFTKSHVYVYDSTKGNLLPGYPKPACNGWFACGKASQASNWNKQTLGAQRQNTGRENHHRHRPHGHDRHRHHHHRHRDDK